MDIKRAILYAAFFLVAYSLWTQWQIEYPSVQNQQTAVTSSASNKPVPELAQNKTYPTVEKNYSLSDKTIQVKTDVLNVNIDLKNGDVVGALLLDYPISVEEKDKPFPLLHESASQRYVANSNLFTVKDNQIHDVDMNFSSAQQQYFLSPDQQELKVVLTTNNNPDNLAINKTYTFTKGSYLIQVDYQISNQGTLPWTGYVNTQLERTTPVEQGSGIFPINSYTGASYSVPGQSKYKKVPFKQMGKSNLDVQSQGGWIAMQQHYFLSAWIPDQGAKNEFYSRFQNNNYSIGAVSSSINVLPNSTQAIGSKLYIGPEVTSNLKEIAPGLDLTVDYGLLWFISSLIFSLMKAIYSVVGNWGWAIVLVTLLIKLAFYRLSATSYKSMAAMRKLQPKLQALRERHGDDKAKMSQATMELYRQEKVNPLGGCLPILVQFPIFIALYWVLIESVELRQAPFILWINDLAVPDIYHVLPIIMGATMLIQQRLNPAPPDPMQAKIMMLLPIVFTALFWNVPSGLVLYWTVNNTLSILQQWYITRKYSDDKPKKKLLTVK
jgi:YidC/Oxa1 family membrane protein insertase